MSILRILTLVLVLAFLGTNLSSATYAAAADVFVKTSGTNFTLEGKPFRFVGFNLFDAAATDRYKCAWWPRMSDEELDTAFAVMKKESGTSVIRFWAFQNYTDGGRDWSGVDRVLRLAKKNELKVIPVLENGPAHCTGNTSQQKWEYQSDTWYTEGYKKPFGSDRLSYREYVRTIVTKYKDDPTILGWMMMNEADTSKRDAQNRSVLVNFATDIGELIRSIDANHLITLGTQSNGASGASGKDFVEVYSLPVLDFSEAHDWGYWSGNEFDPLPGSSDGKTLPDTAAQDCLKTYQAKIGCSLANAVKVVKKPFVIGEAGIKAQDTPASRQARADALEKKMKVAFDNGTAGYLVWQWNTIVDSEKYDVLQKHNDPLLPKMKALAESLTLVEEKPKKGCSTADFNDDGKVDGQDFEMMRPRFFKKPVEALYDLKPDGRIDIQDFQRFIKQLGKNC